jgi:acetylornithine deacetylase/succinyl-diaminopimelate desuccinylase-like protein
MATPAVPSGVYDLNELLRLNEVQDACRFFETEAQSITEEQIEICSVPASPFDETARAEHLLQKFQNLGLEDATIDAEGNCLALRRGISESPLIVLSAHLDTVFPTNTDFTVRRIGNRLLGPGISDDGCGLIALVVLLRALQEFKIDTCGSILFVGTVGEEGEGNLRGVRYLFEQSEWGKKVDAFVSLDGAGLTEVTNRALGSRRYHVQVSGSGGHSWADFGVPNPLHAIGRAIAKLSAYPIPIEPRTSFNVGRVVGGTSVNAIPTEASMEVDLRSATEDELVRIDAYFRRTVREAIDNENLNRRSGTEPLNLQLKLIGTRPGGETSLEMAIAQVAFEATHLVGVTPCSEQASTDANLPMSLGLPAITLGAGGSAANSHTLDEWFDPTERHLGLKRALLVLLGTVGVVQRAGQSAVS